MKKLLIALACASISLSATAMTGHGYKILSETHTISPGATGWLQHDVGDEPMIGSKLAKAKVTPYDARGRKNTNITLTARHCYYIFNETTAVQRFKLHYELFSNGMSAIHEIELELAGYGESTECADNYLVVNFDKANQHKIVGITQVKGPSSALDRKNATLIVTN